MKQYDTINNSVSLYEIDKLGEKFLKTVKESSPNKMDIIESDYHLAKENINIINKFLNNKEFENE